MNYFASADAASRYALGRPDVHARNVGQIRSFLRLDRPLEAALDVACGTGLSTRALRAIASVVYGVDVSGEMLRQAPPLPGVHYVEAPAEALPFASDTFDIVTVSSGVHWFDIDRFLAEARRVLRDGGWLILYDNHFDSKLDPDEAFRRWCADVHFRRYPAPPRKNAFDGRGVTPGFTFVDEISSVYTLPWSRRQLANFLVTNSNVIARMEAGETTFEAAEALLLSELEPFMGAGVRDLYFRDWVKFLAKML